MQTRHWPSTDPAIRDRSTQTSSELPDKRAFSRGLPLRIYAEAGVAHTWLVNPVERTLEVLRLDKVEQRLDKLALRSELLELKTRVDGLQEQIRVLETRLAE